VAQDGWQAGCPVVQPTMSQHCRKQKALSPTSGLASSVFIRHRTPEKGCCSVYASSSVLV